MLIDFPDEAIFTLIASTRWELYFDGSYTNHGAGAKNLCVTPQGDLILKLYRINFPGTNNMAGYEALITRLCTAIQWKITYLHVYGNSQLIINQVNDDYTTKDDKLMPYKQMVDDYKQHFSHIIFEQIPRLQNKVSDVMAIVGSLLDMSRNITQLYFMVEQLMVPTYEIPP